MSNEYLDFAAISKAVSFEQLFNWLNIPFTKTDKELKGDGFVVTIHKNLYINPKMKQQRGGPINFLSHLFEIDLRTAASEIKKQFLTNGKPKEDKQIPDLELHYTDQLMTYNIDEELAQAYEVGLVKQRSIMAGKIAIKVYNPDDSLSGYIGYDTKGWYFPKGFTRPIWNLNRLKEAEFIFLTTDVFDALKLISLGFPHTTSLLGSSLTDEQLNQLSSMEYLQSIHLIHPEPMNIVQRVAKHLFIRYTIPPPSIREISSSEFIQYLSSP